MQSRRQYDTGAENNSRASDVREPRAVDLGVAEIQVLEESGGSMVKASACQAGAVIKVQKLHPSSVSSFQTRQILEDVLFCLTDSNRQSYFRKMKN